MSLLRVYLGRSLFEIRVMMRDRSAVVFSMLLPVFLLVIFGSVFGHQTIAHTGVRISQYLVAGLLASGLLYSSFQLLAIAIPEERSTGALKRLRGSPMPRSAYFVGKFATSVVVYVAQSALLLSIGHYTFDITLPTRAGWLTFAWVSALGLVASSLLGVALSAAARDGKSASAIAAPMVIFFQFTSGVYFVYTSLPQWMQRLAAFFPLKWMAPAMRSVFLPAAFGRDEAAGSFELSRAALVLALWVVIGIVLARFAFRWSDEGE